MILINRTSWDVGDFVQTLKELPNGCPTRLLVDNAVRPTVDMCAFVILRANGWCHFLSRRHRGSPAWLGPSSFWPLRMMLVIGRCLGRWWRSPSV